MRKYTPRKNLVSYIGIKPQKVMPLRTSPKSRFLQVYGKLCAIETRLKKFRPPLWKFLATPLESRHWYLTADLYYITHYIEGYSTKVQPL